MPFDLDLYRRHLGGGPVGAAVRFRELTVSTMDDARAGAALPEAVCGTAYAAGEQTAGRGRQGRSWVSAAASGLYVTYHLCPPSQERAPLLSLAGALAAAEAIAVTSGVGVDVKWPNDLLHDGRKLAGILAEARPGPGRRFDVLLGIGINLRSSAELPPEVAAIATSIEQAGGASTPPEVLMAALSNALGVRAAQAERDPERLVADWRARLVTLGRRVRFEAPAGAVEGEAIDVTPRGELVLRLGDGSTRSFAAGDVHTM
jgi:BirA family transcriptional regulator, biotin operon repressor / biotin---[acetyl-CoA-carboxylase] ligase